MVGVGFEEAGHRSLPNRRLSQELLSSCLGHLATLTRLMFLWENFFGLSGSDLDFWFDPFNEAQKSCIVLCLSALVDQLLTVGKLDSSARVPEPADPRDSL